jgi:hypothetical protein
VLEHPFGYMGVSDDADLIIKAVSNCNEETQQRVREELGKLV